MRDARRLTAIVLLAGGVCLPAVAGDDWGYTGDKAPENWASIDDAYLTCATGRQQSPIDLSSATPVVERDAPEVVGEILVQPGQRLDTLELIDNGHTVQVVADSAIAISISGERYELVQMHFHAPSEHTIDGQSFPLEAHFVTSNAAGDLAVIGEFFVAGEASQDYAPLLASLPAGEGEARVLTDLDFDLASLNLHPDSYYEYPGSLTTPPCSEGVKWFVAREPTSMSTEQLQGITALLDGNARPVQPLNDRELLLVETDAD